MSGRCPKISSLMTAIGRLAVRSSVLRVKALRTVAETVAEYQRLMCAIAGKLHDQSPHPLDHAATKCAGLGPSTVFPGLCT